MNGVVYFLCNMAMLVMLMLGECGGVRVAVSGNIKKWLQDNGFGKYAEAFAQHEIDIDVLADLSEQDLESLGMAMGPRKRFMRAVAAFSDEGGEDAAQAKSQGEAPPPQPQSADIRASEGERRHLTVMFCDMVGSTALSERLDPEDFREAISMFRDACSRGIQDYEGFIARYMGDGILVYFGYPQAHENDAERAVRSALTISKLLDGLNAPDGTPMKMRVGIASGLVVAGDVIGEGASEERSVLGDTPNLAARLQSLAPPNGIVIAEGTHRLVGGLFVCGEMGAQKLKGISGSVAAFQVEGESDAQSRFEAASQHGLTPLVGRKEEIDLLHKRWEQAKEGDGQVVLLSGEAGVGKSRLLSTFQESLAEENHRKIFCYCSPFRQNSALFPIISYLEQSIRFTKDDDPGAKLDKVEKFISELGLPRDEYASIVATTLELPGEGRYGPIELTPQQLRDRTLEVIASLIEAQAEKIPALIVLEDIHWVDPTTLELCGRIIKRLRGMQALFVIACRPEFDPPWKSIPNITSYSLNHLSSRECATLAVKVAKGKSLPDEVITQIVERTDGIPLFIEEMTKSLLESDFMKDVGDHYELTAPLSSVVIPESLMDSLMARLDRLGAVKDIAQMGAVIGRNFSYELLSNVSPLEGGLLRKSLDELVESGLVFQRGIPPQAVYEFQHALIQDAAYKSLLRSRRQQLHALIAETMQQRFPEQVELEPEVLAHHFTKAGIIEQAVVFWHRAGDKSIEHSSNKEAIGHICKGVDLVRTLDESPQRDKMEVGLLLALGPALIAVEGFAAPRVIEAYDRARELCRKLGDTSRLFSATWGTWLYYQQGGQIENARKLADEVLELSVGTDNKDFQLQAHHASWTTLFRMGHFSSCHEYAERGTKFYNFDEHCSHSTIYGGHDPGMCAHYHEALSLWFLGFADLGVENMNAALKLAGDLSHPFNLALAHSFAAFLYKYRREAPLALHHANEAMELGAMHGFAQIRAQSAAVRGWALAEDGKTDEGLSLIQKSLDDFRTTGAGVRQPFILSLQAEIYGRIGETEEGLTALEEAVKLIEASGERTDEASAHMLMGDLILQSSRSPAEAEASYDSAMIIARGQSARAVELCTATRLARLWHGQNRTKEAHNLLSPIYAQFTEGFETPDLLDAKEALILVS